MPQVRVLLPRPYADVAELADALDSGSSGSNTVGVQVPSSAPKPEFIRTPVFLYLSSSLVCVGV